MKDLPNNFVAIDVELANNDRASICEIGAARFRNGQLIETWRILVSPQQKFTHEYHSRTHGLNSNQVIDAPSFNDIYDRLARFIDGEVCISHSNSDFDKNCLRKSCLQACRHDITASCDWLNTHDLAKECWPDASSYRLADLCKKIGYEYHAHSALEDAMAAAAIFLKVSGTGNIEAIAGSKAAPGKHRTYRKVSGDHHQKGLKGNPDGKFYSTHIILTGEFSPPFADRAAFERHLNDLGFVPRRSFSKKTKFLVTGSNPGPKKIEHAKANNIRIMNESEFRTLIS